MESKIIAIHQPNFFPWLGFFNKIYNSDAFVYLNHVENNPRTSIYTKRVKILVNKQEYWLTVSLKSEPQVVFMPINEMRIDNPERLKDKQLKTWELTYKKAPYFNNTFHLIENFYNNPSPFIAERNITCIDEICKILNITTTKVNSDSLYLKSTSNELLIDIIKQLKGTVYRAGGGAQGYQQDELFIKNGIALSPQEFKHPVYKQYNSSNFVAGLSIIDALMNLGFLETELLIKNA